jgi:hypothetical protein
VVGKFTFNYNGGASNRYYGRGREIIPENVIVFDFKFVIWPEMCFLEENEVRFLLIYESSEFMDFLFDTITVPCHYS